MAQTFRLMMISLALVFVWAPATGAMADELFICDGNKNVRVPLDKLDHMKRTNACVAAHYGLEIQAKSAPSANPKQRLHKLVTGPVRVHKKAVKAKSGRKKKVTATPTVRTVPAAKAAPAKAPVARATSGVKIYRRGEALPVEDVAAQPSDHRNIRVLNAKSKPTQWYRHIY